jgi:hypothetical protein
LRTWRYQHAVGQPQDRHHGTYHAFGFAEYAHRYLAEFQYRFNRRFDMKTILSRLLHALLAAPLSQEHQLRLAEVSC